MGLINQLGNIPSPEDLFKTYYKLKFPEDKNLPDSIYNDFLDLRNGYV